jgi:hypothetical protein
MSESRVEGIWESARAATRMSQRRCTAIVLVQLARRRRRIGLFLGVEQDPLDRRLVQGRAGFFFSRMRKTIRISTYSG